MGQLWQWLEFANLLTFTLFIIPRRQPTAASPLITPLATHLLRAMFLLPILAFGYSLFITQQVSGFDWLCLGIALIGTLLVIKGKRDLGQWHTWAGTWLPGAPTIRTGIYRWLPHPMYTGIILTIVSCSLVYITRLPVLLSALALLCCLYIVTFLLVVAVRERRHLSPV